MWCVMTVHAMSCLALLLFCLCVLCHGIVGLVLCLCGRVVSLWNSGDGLCRAEGRVVSTVHCQFFMCCVVGCGMAVGCARGVWSRRLSSSFSSLLSLRVGVRGSARAALRARTLSPNTIVSSTYCSSSLFSAPRLSSLLFHFPLFLCC